MAEHRAGIHQVVAAPKQFLWAPFELAIINIVLACVVMLISIMILGLTPFFSLVPLILGHAGLVVAGTRNPHLTTTLQAAGKYPSSRKNLAKVKTGVKFIP